MVLKKSKLIISDLIQVYKSLNNFFVFNAFPCIDAVDLITQFFHPANEFNKFYSRRDLMLTLFTPINWFLEAQFNAGQVPEGAAAAAL